MHKQFSLVATVTVRGHVMGIHKYKKEEAGRTSPGRGPIISQTITINMENHCIALFSVGFLN